MAAGKKLLLLRFGELWLKSHEVRKRFKDRLLTNISDSFNAGKIPFRLVKSHDRIFLEVPQSELKKSVSLLSGVFGLVSFSLVEETGADRKKIAEKVIRIASKTLKQKDTFAVRARRTGKHEFRSQELERELGALIVERFGNRVNLSNPGKTFFVEIRDNSAYIFSEKIPAQGGLPLGVEGKVAVLFDSDYRKSIIAAFLMMKRGCKAVPLFIKPLAGEKEKDAIKILSKYDPLVKPVFIKSGKDAFKASKENRARAVIFPDSLEDVLSRKRPAFDKKTGIFALEPLVGFDEKKLKEMYRTICLVN